MLDFGSIIKESALVLRRHYILAVPSIIAVLLASFISLAVVKSPEDTSRMLLMGFISMLLSLYAHGVTLAMAREALETGSTSMQTASFIAVRLFRTFSAAALIMGGLVGTGSMFFVIPGFIAALFLMFTFPSIVVDTVGAVEALRRSYTIVKANMRDSAMFFGIVIAFGLVFGMVNIILSVVPVAGQLAGVVLSGALGGFVGVMMVRVYKALQRRMYATNSA
jgi:hypothetical protein